jgi:hypothetical protein
MLEHSIEETIEQLDACERKAYRSLIEPVVSNFAALVEEILGPILHIPGSPFVLARFGLSALLPALSLTRRFVFGQDASQIQRQQLLKLSHNEDFPFGICFPIECHHASDYLERYVCSK